MFKYSAWDCKFGFRDRISNRSWPEKKVLVIINPASGRKKGMQTYWNIVAPMLVEASYKFRSIVTTGPGHASQVNSNNFA